jgi:hypothetical protein
MLWVRARPSDQSWKKYVLPSHRYLPAALIELVEPTIIVR